MSLNNPTQLKIDGKLYNINTDFRVALECNRIARDTSIGDYERALAIIYKLLGEEGLDCHNQNKALELCMKYISFNKEEKDLENEPHNKFNLDFDKCIGLIRSSFKFDYNYDPYELDYLHWYDFYNDLENLSTSEFGNCCILNRITSILNQKPGEIKDSKARKELIETQKILKEKYCEDENSKKEITEDQIENAKNFYSQIKLE